MFSVIIFKSMANRVFNITSENASNGETCKVNLEINSVFQQQLNDFSNCI